MNVYVREYKKIEHRTRRRESFMLRYLPLLLLLAGAVVMGKVYVQSVAIRWSSDAMALRDRARDLELQNEELLREIAGLTTRDRVARAAERSLDMVVPEGDEIVWLPVLEAAPMTRPAEAAPRDEDRDSRLAAWLGSLWQEEALALTSR